MSKPGKSIALAKMASGCCGGCEWRSGVRRRLVGVGVICGEPDRRESDPTTVGSSGTQYTYLKAFAITISIIYFNQFLQDKYIICSSHSRQSDHTAGATGFFHAITITATCAADRSSESKAKRPMNSPKYAVYQVNRSLYPGINKSRMVSGFQSIICFSSSAM